MKLLNGVHGLLGQHLQAGDIALDATVGNGHDTLVLAKLVGPTGMVYGFDIQQPALANTLAKCRAAKLEACLCLIATSHAQMQANIPERHHGKIKACLFNLGYLPGGDKRIITRSESTLAALDSACRLLAPTGIITVLAYPGHKGGDLETAHVEQWCIQLDAKEFKVCRVHSEVHQPSAPRLFVICKQQACALI